MKDTFQNYLRANIPIIVIDTIEQDRAMEIITQSVEELNKELSKSDVEELGGGYQFNIYKWNMYSGLSLNNSPILGTHTLDACLAAIAKDKTQMGVFLLQNYHLSLKDDLNNGYLIETLRAIANECVKQHKHIVLLGDAYALPVELQKEVVVMELPLPSKQDIQTYIQNLINSWSLKLRISKDNIKKVSELSQGMTLKEVDTAVRLALIESNGEKIDTGVIYNEKKKIVKKSGLLELIEHNENINTLGGLDRFKEGVSRVKKIFQNPSKAKKFGLTLPKGYILTGINGTGKTLAAKVMSSELGVPLYRCDIGRLFDSRLGNTERNTRELIKLLPSIAPCVVLFDEAEKMFSGVKSSEYTDGGVTSRVIASLLFAFEEIESLTFRVATMNSISVPPEMLRKGRWDEIWFVDLPTDNERRAIFNIHIQKSGRNPEQFGDVIHDLVIDSKSFTGVEIEAAVQEGLSVAFKEDREVVGEDILTAVRKTTPIAILKKEEIESMRQWAKERAKFASSPETDSFPSKNNKRR